MGQWQRGQILPWQGDKRHGGKYSPGSSDMGPFLEMDSINSVSFAT